MNAETTDRVAPSARGFDSFKIDLVSDDIDIERDSLVEGFVQNTGSNNWGERHLVGLRNFRDPFGTSLPGVEFRAVMGSKVTAPGGRTRFRFDLRCGQIPSQAAACTLDVVEEHVAWLSQYGSEPVELRVASTHTLDDWLSALCELRHAATAPLQRKLDILARVINYGDLARQESFLCVRKLLEGETEAKPYRKLKPDSTLVASIIQRLDKGDPHELFLRHFATLTGERVDFDDPEDSARLFARFVREGGPAFRGAAVPLPTKLCAWLGRRALPTAIASTPATRSMISTLEPGAYLELNPPDGGAGMTWRFVTSVLIDRGLTEALLPNALLASLTRPSRPLAFTDIVPEPTRFADRLYADTPAYQARYALGEDWSRLAFLIDLCMLSLENETRRALLGAELLQWLTEPLSDEIDVSVLEVVLLASCNRAVPDFSGSIDDGDIARLRRSICWLAPDRSPPASSENPIRLIGEIHSPSGLGVNMRMSKTALERINIGIEILDVQEDLFYPPVSKAGGFALRRPVDLFHLNLEAVPALVCRYSEPARRDVYKIAFALWETSVMPEQHRAGMELVDEIWAPTEYVAEVYRAAGHPNVHVVGKGISLPRPTPFDLGTIGIAAGVTTFLLSFDMGSWADRKNPIAAVRAFQVAFPSDPYVRLIIKTNGLGQHPGDRTNQAGRIEAAADADPRIILLSELLPFQRYLGLIAAVDATVSSHRSEGFGYVPAYSMLLGTATIVTDHSGTSDFCTAETSYPVSARLISVRLGDFVFDSVNALWADVDIDAFARAMRQVRDDPEEARRRTARGKALVAGRYSIEALARRYAERLATI